MNFRNSDKDFPLVSPSNVKNEPICQKTRAKKPHHNRKQEEKMDRIISFTHATYQLSQSQKEMDRIITTSQFSKQNKAHLLNIFIFFFHKPKHCPDIILENEMRGQSESCPKLFSIFQ